MAATSVVAETQMAATSVVAETQMVATSAVAETQMASFVVLPMVVVRLPKGPPAVKYLHIYLFHRPSLSTGYLLLAILK